MNKVCSVGLDKETQSLQFEEEVEAYKVIDLNNGEVANTYTFLADAEEAALSLQQQQGRNWQVRPLTW